MPRYPLCADHDWCFYQAIDNYTIVVEISYLAALIVFTLVLCRKFKQLLWLRRNTEHKRLFGQGFMQVYYIIFAWLICTLVKVIINIAVYMTLMTPEDGIDPQSDQPIVILSSVFLFFQYGCGFWLMFLMLLIPYSWVNQLLLNTCQIDLIPNDIRRNLNRCFNYLKFLKFYCRWVRPLFVVWLVAQPFILFFTQTNIGCQSLAYNAYFIYFESLLIFMTYIFGYLVTRYMQKNNLLVLSSEDEKRIIKQYVFLLSVMILRICLNFIFKISKIYEYEPNSTCYDNNHKTASFIFLLLAQFFMHLFPVCVILYIYSPNVDKRLREQKILSFVQNRKTKIGETKKGETKKIEKQYDPIEVVLLEQESDNESKTKISYPDDINTSS